MKLAILGGSFNPVHIGHLCLADAVLSAFEYDRVILIPAHISPFKPDAGGASAKERLKMLSASITGDPRFGIDDCEITREGVSYTIDTVRDIRKRYCPDGKPGLILGDDLISDFYKWNRAEEIAEEVDFIIARRLPDSQPAEDAKKSFSYPCMELNNEIINVSSNLVRDKIEKNQNWRYLVPQGARLIIEESGLYGCRSTTGTAADNDSGDDYTGTIFRMENIARETLNMPRFLHSRNTALMTLDLCKRYGLDPNAGYLAGITHDICKTMSDDELIKLAHKDGKGMSSIEKQKPGLLHGRAAAVLLKTKYGIKNDEILEAVASHVTCGEYMGNFAKILYIADKIEYSRSHVSSSLRNTSELGLDELFVSVLGETVSFIRSEHKDISKNALRLLAAVKKVKKSDKKSKN